MKTEPCLELGMWSRVKTILSESVIVSSKKILYWSISLINKFGLALRRFSEESHHGDVRLCCASPGGGISRPAQASDRCARCHQCACLGSGGICCKGAEPCRRAYAGTLTVLGGSHVALCDSVCLFAFPILCCPFILAACFPPWLFFGQEMKVRRRAASCNSEPVFSPFQKTFVRKQPLISRAFLYFLSFLLLSLPFLLHLLFPIPSVPLPCPFLLPVQSSCFPVNLLKIALAARSCIL